MTNTPLLSVIIPVYNTESYLRNCLDSVINQTYKNIEILCVNDGSTDGSRDILQEYLKRDNRIRIIDQENMGLVRARKNGLECSHGEFIAYVDSDDWIDLNMYEEMVGFLTHKEVEIVTSGCFREYGDNTTIESEAMEVGVYSGEKRMLEFLENMIGHDVFYEQNIKLTLWSKMYRRSALYKYQMAVEDNIRIGEDAAVVYPILLNCNSIFVSGRNYYHYRIRSDSMTRNNDKREEEAVRAFEQYISREFHRAKEYPYKDIQLLTVKLFARLVAVPETVVRFSNGVLFPYLAVKQEDKIVVYGTGRYGKKLANHLRKIGANIIAVCDQNVEKGVVSVDDLCRYEFDKVVIGVINKSLVEQIVKALLNKGVSNNKISCINIDEIRKNEPIIL